MKGTQGFGLACTRAAITGTAATTLLLSGCLSSGQDEGEADGNVDAMVSISGSVGDGPAVDASIVILSNTGEELATLKSDSRGSYQTDMNLSSSSLPLIVRATGGTDIVTNAAPDFTLVGALTVIRNDNVANLNPFSTFAVEIARDMNGGINGQNLARAEDIIVVAMNSGLTTLVTDGPMETPIGPDNVAEIIKASEILGEIVRRTRDAMNDAGRGTNGNATIAALASDLIDGVIEGNGGPRSDSRLAAVTSVVSSQVLLEAMANELHVNGADATAAMRSAVRQVEPSADDSAIDRIGATREMIDQAMNGLSAAYAVTADDRIYELMGALAGVQVGMEPSLVKSLLPADYRGALNSSVVTAANGDNSVVRTINSVIRDNTKLDNANRAPTISGQPAPKVRAGREYDFRPTASDLDNDPLTFSIQGKPGWATFDETTGRLFGTPQSGDAGRHDGITITVSDGDMQNRLGPFSIEVTVSNSAPTISGSPATSVTVGQAYSFRPQANDSDGQALTFSISGKPDWARFNRSTGVLSGTPSDGDVGVYRSIEISVSDGEQSTSLAPFSIEVVAAAAGTGSVSISWTPPTQNEDGSQLTDLVGYRVYWGRSGNGYSNVARIDNASVTRFVVEFLPPGDYELVATAVNRSGVESRFSNAVTKRVN